MRDLRADLLALLTAREADGCTYIRMADIRAVLDRHPADPDLARLHAIQLDLARAQDQALSLMGVAFPAEEVAP